MVGSVVAINVLSQVCIGDKADCLFSSHPSLLNRARASSVVPSSELSGLLGGRLGSQAAVGGV